MYFYSVDHSVDVSAERLSELTTIVQMHCASVHSSHSFTAVSAVHCRCLDMLIGVLTSKHQFSSAFYHRMFDQIRQSRDALKPDSKSTTKVDRL